MLKSTSNVTVNPACPAENEIARGAYAAIRIASGSSAHRSARSAPIATINRPPTTIPTAVPKTAWTTVAPVPSAFERSTDSVPSTTQKACCSDARCATYTAIVRPAAPRTLF